MKLINIKKTYIVGTALNIIKDATSLSTHTEIRAIEEEKNGQEKYINYIPSFASTAQTSSSIIMFPHPMLIAKNTFISINNSNAAANITAHANIYYYEED